MFPLVLFVLPLDPSRTYYAYILRYPQGGKNIFFDKRVQKMFYGFSNEGKKKLFVANLISVWTEIYVWIRASQSSMDIKKTLCIHDVMMLARCWVGEIEKRKAKNFDWNEKIPYAEEKKMSYRVGIFKGQRNTMEPQKKWNNNNNNNNNTTHPPPTQPHNEYTTSLIPING